MPLPLPMTPPEPYETLYHLGFSRADIAAAAPKIALLAGDPQRTEAVANGYLQDVKVLSTNRGLNSYLGQLPNGVPILAATSGMGAPSLSIVVNELCQLGLTTIIRIGTSGAIQPSIAVGDVVISSAAVCYQGAADDVAPREYPAVADPFVTVSLAHAARALKAAHHVGITASTDTFYEGQGRFGGAKAYLMAPQRERVELLQRLNVLNFEMEAATLFKLGSVYGFRAGCVCGVLAQRTAAEAIVLDKKAAAVDAAIRVALKAASQLETLSQVPNS